MLSWYIALGALAIWLLTTLVYTRKYYGPWLKERRKRKAALRKAALRKAAVGKAAVGKAVGK